MDEDQRKTRHRGARSRWTVPGVALLVVVGALLYKFQGPLLARLATGPEYLAAFSTIGGLQPGDRVRFGGIAVGRVRSTQIDPDDSTHIRVTFRVGEHTPMRADTRASVVDATNPVTRYLSLRPGSRAAPPLPAGKPVETEVGPTVEETLTRVTDVLGRTDTLLRAAEPLIRGDFFARLDRTTARLDALTGEVTRAVRRTGPGLEQTTARLVELLDHTTRLVAKVDSLSPELAAASDEAVGMLHDTRALVGELRASGLQGGELAELVQSLTTTSENLARLAAQMERQPLSVLRGRRMPDKPAGPPAHE
jgi:phospholipid/cholesterol/gamma-HCH transport system substrate-binding protein